jgi:hypothetical protein
MLPGCDCFCTSYLYLASRRWILYGTREVRQCFIVEHRRHILAGGLKVLPTRHAYEQYEEQRSSERMGR